MVLSDHAETGAGTLAALQLLAELVAAAKPASELLHQFDPVPQLLKNVRFAGGKPLDDQHVIAAIAEGEATLNGRGRLVIRPSGTEPLIRVMAEGDDAGQVRSEEHTSELQSLMRISYAVFCLKKKKMYDEQHITD